MAQVNVDPEELRRFAGNLQQFNGDLDQLLSRIRGQFQQLGSTWDDGEYKKFEEVFERTVQQLRQYVQVSEAFIPVLQRKAQHIDSYKSGGFSNS